MEQSEKPGPNKTVNFAMLQCSFEELSLWYTMQMAAQLLAERSGLVLSTDDALGKPKMRPL